MWMVLASFLAMTVGPVLLHLAGGARTLLVGLDAFVLVTLGGLVVVHILPQSMAIAGGSALLATVLGMVGLVVMEQSSERLAHKVWRAALPILLLGLGIHAFLDGVGLAHGHHDHAHTVSALPLAVVLHRIPVGLAIWWGVRPRFGIQGALLVMGILVIGTIIGQQYGETLIEILPAEPLALLQAFIGGALLHGVVGHTFDVKTERESHHLPVAGAMGALLGCALLGALSAVDPPGRVLPEELSAGSMFMTLALETAPYILAGYALTWVLTEVFAQHRMQRVSQLPPGRVLEDAVAEGLAGLGVGQLFQRFCGLLAEGQSRRVALSFLLAVPGASLAAVLLSLELLGVALTLSWWAGGIGLSLLLAWLLSRVQVVQPDPLRQSWNFEGAYVHTHVHTRAGGQETPFEVPWERWGERLMRPVDATASWVLLGLGLAALLEALFQAHWLKDLSPWVELPLMGLLGLPLSLSVVGLVPVVAVLVHKGLGLGAAVVLLISGPVLGLKVLRGLRQAGENRLALLLVLGLFGGSMLLGALVELSLPATVPHELHFFNEKAHAWYERVSLAVVGGLYLFSLLRQGPRGLLHRVVGTEGGHLHAPQPPIPAEKEL